MLLVILLSILPMYHYKRFTARKLDISTGQKPLVSTGFLPGTGWSVLNVTAFSTGRSDQYQMTQSSTGHQHRPVLKIFLSKKSNCFSGSSSFLSSFFSFHHRAPSFFSVFQEQTSVLHKQRKSGGKKRSLLEKKKNKQKGRSEEPEKLHLSYNIQVKITKTKNYNKNYTTQEIQQEEIQHSTDT